MPDPTTHQTVTVRLFAAARDAVGDDSVQLTLSKNGHGPVKIADVRNALSKAHPQLAEIVAHSMFAVDQEYRSDSEPVPASATVACIPPVSGG